MTVYNCGITVHIIIHMLGLGKLWLRQWGIYNYA